MLFPSASFVIRYRTAGGSDRPGYAVVPTAQSQHGTRTSSRDDCVPRPVATAAGSVTTINAFQLPPSLAACCHQESCRCHSQGSLAVRVPQSSSGGRQLI